MIKPEYIDIHAHLNFSAFDSDRSEVISRMEQSRVFAINIGTQQDTSRKAVELSKKYQGLYAGVGLHPIHTSKSHHDKSELGEEGSEFTSRGEEFDFEFYKHLAHEPKTVAIGECGLDYFRTDPDSEKKQIDAFRAQIALSQETGKPLMLHLRSGQGKSAYNEAAKMIKVAGGAQGNSHFFAGSFDEAKNLLDLGISLSFTGVITFARDYDDVLKKIPLDMIMAETDCPYVPPLPYRGKRNEPSYVIEVYKKIAEIKKMPEEVIRQAIIENAFRLFKM